MESHANDRPGLQADAAWDLRDPEQRGAWVLRGLRPAGEDEFHVESGEAVLESPILELQFKDLLNVALALELPSGTTTAECRVSARVAGSSEFLGYERSRFSLLADGKLHVYRVGPPDHMRTSEQNLSQLRFELEGLPSRVRIQSVTLRRRDRWRAETDRRRIHVLSHRRSGTHFLLESLKKNIEGYEILKRGHEPARITHIAEGDHAIHIYRDGRDVLVSNYRWWRTSQESENFGIRPLFQDVSFADYVLGRVEIRVPDYRNLDGCGFLPEDYFADPVGFWLQFVDDYLARTDVLHVRYEDLKADPAPVIRAAAAMVDQEVDTVRTQDELTGYMPNKGAIGRHREFFDDELLAAFWERAGEKMEQWGYSLQSGA